MRLPNYKDVDSIPRIIAWFIEHDNVVKSDLWNTVELRDNLTNWMISLFRDNSQDEVKEIVNVVFHEFTYLSLPKFEDCTNKHILTPEEEEMYNYLQVKIAFQQTQLRISVWIYQQKFNVEFIPFGNPFDILGYFDGFVDFYNVLGVSSCATPDEIKKVFRSKAKLLHPDVGGNEDVFKQFKEAYDVLSNKSKRQEFHQKYEFYHKRHEYDISDVYANSDSNSTIKSEPIRTFVIGFKWRSFLRNIIIVVVFILVGNLVFEKFDTKEEQLVDLNRNTSIPVTVPFDLKDEETEKSKIDMFNTNTSSFFTLGSTKKEVKRIMGEPDEIQYFGNVSIWVYSDSTIHFDETEKVASWSNSNHNLRVSIGSKKEDASAFTKGSSVLEVVNAMGTPDEITHWGAIWHYEDSIVEFDEDKVIGWSNNSVNLKVK